MSGQTYAFAETSAREHTELSLCKFLDFDHAIYATLRVKAVVIQHLTM